MKDEPVDLVFWIPYAASVITFIIIPHVGQWFLLGVFLLFHVVCFFSTYKYWIWSNEEKTVSYHRHFSHTHHIIKVREKILVPDTFHIIVFSLLFINLIATILFILM